MVIYDPIPRGGDPHGSGFSPSTTEVDEALIRGEDKEYSWNQNSRRKRNTRGNLFVELFHAYHTLVDTFLILTIVFLLFIVIIQLDSAASAATPPTPPGTPRSKLQLGGDFAGAGPTFETEIVKFTPDFSFVPPNATAMFSPATLDKWNTIMPLNAGWGDLDPKSPGFEGSTFFTTSMTHSLHCLFMMARTYAAVADPDADAMTKKLPADYHDHFFHCVDYLRQGVMCAGDVAMEGHLPGEPEDFGPKDGGWNAHHVCKDYDQVILYLDQQIKDGVRVVLPIDD